MHPFFSSKWSPIWWSLFIHHACKHACSNSSFEHSESCLKATWIDLHHFCIHFCTLILDQIWPLNSTFSHILSYFHDFSLCFVCLGSRPWMHELRAALFQDLTRTSSSRGLSRRLDRVDITVLQWIESICREIRPGRFLCSDPSDLCSFEFVGRPSARERQLSHPSMRHWHWTHTHGEPYLLLHYHFEHFFSAERSMGPRARDHSFLQQCHLSHVDCQNFHCVPHRFTNSLYADIFSGWLRAQ